jgi:hypothetical protein
LGVSDENVIVKWILAHNRGILTPAKTNELNRLLKI